MQKENLDFIPSRMKNNGLSLEDAKREILTALYLHPKRFNLLDLDIDDREDFILHAYEKFDSFFRNYNPSICPFGAYVLSSIYCLKLSWKRKKYQESIFKDNCLQDMLYEQEEKNIEKNNISEIPTTYRGSNALSKNETPSLVFHRIFSRPKDSCIKQQINTLQRTSLILALKSAWYINDSHIEKVSKLCGCHPDTIAKIIHSIKDELVDKAQRFEDLQKHRDTSYYHLRNYQLQLQNINKTDANYEKVESKKKFQYKNWKKKNEILRKGLKKVAPSNSRIGEIIGINSKKVSNYLSLAKYKSFIIDEDNM